MFIGTQGQVLRVTNKRKRHKRRIGTQSRKYVRYAGGKPGNTRVKSVEKYIMGRKLKNIHKRTNQRKKRSMGGTHKKDN